MKVYVVKDSDGYIGPVFSKKVDAITYCQKMIECEDLDISEWDCYYSIHEADFDN